MTRRAGVATLRALKSLGVRLAIDELRHRHSSLAYLKRFPIDILKIDRSFVDGLGRNAQDEAIVASTLTLARALGLDVVAEGVETQLQQTRLHELGCVRAQGYLFARPQQLATLLTTFAPVERLPRAA